MHGGHRCHYDWHLVRDIKRSLEADARALDPKGMNDFMENGFLLRELGGVFVYDVDTFGRLHSAVVQSVRNRKYLQEYGRYIAMDGTHMVDKYDHVLVLLFD